LKVFTHAQAISALNKLKIRKALTNNRLRFQTYTNNKIKQMSKVVRESTTNK